MSQVNVPVPNGCRWCGVAREGHGQRWAPDGDWHGWFAPTEEQRVDRMRARREVRHVER